MDSEVDQRFQQVEADWQAADARHAKWMAEMELSHAKAMLRMDRADARMDRAEARMDRFDKQLQATRKLVEAGMKIVIRQGAEFRADLKALKDSQRETDRKFRQFLDSLRKGGNGSR